MKTIYLVRGSAGHYEDYETWIVRAFASKVRAEQFAAQCTARARARWLELWRDDGGDGIALSEASDKPKAPLSRLDPHLEQHNLAAEYDVWPVRFDPREHGLRVRRAK